MRILVLGAGIVGVTSAYALARKGYQVTVIEKNCSVATETSYANGAQLSYSYTDPMATPNMLRKLPSILLGQDKAFQVKDIFSEHMIRWGLGFMRNCTQRKMHENMQNLIALAHESSSAMTAFFDERNPRIHNRRFGKLMLAETEKSYIAGEARAEKKLRLGVDYQCMNLDECLRLEPSLKDWQFPIAGGFFSQSDETLDTCSFTKELARICYEELGVRFHMNTEVRRLILEENNVLGVETNKGEYFADKSVVCLGPYAHTFLKRYRLNSGLYPIKGYSLTMPKTETSPNISITDLERKFVMAPLRDAIRVAGLNDFVGFDRDIDKTRTSYLRNIAREALPTAANYEKVFHKWSGLRPTMPNGLPRLGRTKLDGLYMNIGHGMLGWTLAMGCAERLMRYIEQDRKNTVPVYGGMHHAV
ncbi:FAD-dependent oxidoreductase [Kordiimonas sp. SCSIO 12603]|uniref:FAD-dependent oxidoreductase n=1 Tax=Kordiimonas sp. SCSIO 12603 TaxID=2829596 RepID=UPI00210266D8|nr:FAD-dependent oxidoreductase [Kordiimonas sp. SCSIO 12603]UTW58780.1 FAD-dependent oxidoreductase [Kordiimonas sp. SCSIO 12603]